MPLAIFVRDLTDLDSAPVFASSDPEILAGLAKLIVRRLGAPPPALRAVKPREGRDETNDSQGD